jgi:hypothetical protein
MVSYIPIQIFMTIFINILQEKPLKGKEKEKMFILFPSFHLLYKYLPRNLPPFPSPQTERSYISSLTHQSGCLYWVSSKCFALC